jgi:putative chitinase
VHHINFELSDKAYSVLAQHNKNYGHSSLDKALEDILLSFGRTVIIEAPMIPTHISREQLAALIVDERVDAFLNPLNNIFEQFGITTPLRKAHFMAQMCHESGNFQWLEEIWPDPMLDADGIAHNGNRWQLRYEGRKGLDNTVKGDGYRYRGRGIIQLTGRANYRTYGALTNVDLEAYPDLATRPDVAAAVAGHFWNSRNLNQRADGDDIRTITKAINGGFNGLDDRIQKLEHAKEVFKV